MHDLIYFEDGKVKVSEQAMQIQEFKDFKKYDRSTDCQFFEKAMNYIFYVYKVFGSEKEHVSYLANLPLSQRKIVACKTHTGVYRMEQFEESKWVIKCVEAFLLYSRTQSERLLDALKEDLSKFTSYIETIPVDIEKTIKIDTIIPGTEESTTIPVDIKIANAKERLEALKNVQIYREMYLKLEKQATNDLRNKQRTQARLFEDREVVSKISTDGFPLSNE